MSNVGSRKNAKGGEIVFSIFQIEIPERSRWLETTLHVAVIGVRYTPEYICLTWKLPS